MVADGAYAKANFLKPAMALGMTVVSRLRCDSALWSLPPVVPSDRRGPGQTPALHVPAAAGEQVMTGGGQRGDVSQLTPGDDGERGLGRKSQDLLEPAAHEPATPRVRRTFWR